jgi:hypothetical protein
MHLLDYVRAFCFVIMIGAAAYACYCKGRSDQQKNSPPLPPIAKLRTPKFIATTTEDGSLLIANCYGGELFTLVESFNGGVVYQLNYSMPNREPEVLDLYPRTPATPIRDDQRWQLGHSQQMRRDTKTK